MIAPRFPDLEAIGPTTDPLLGFLARLLRYAYAFALVPVGTDADEVRRFAAFLHGQGPPR